MNGTLEITVPAKVSAPTAISVPAIIDVTALDTAQPLEEIFQPYQTTLAKWKSRVDSLVVTDINQKTEMAQARLARLELKEARVALDKTRKGLVEGLNARTGKINGTAKVIRDQIEALEDDLLASEQFAERHAAQVKSALKVWREAEYAKVSDNPIIGDLSDLSDAQFDTVIADAKIVRQAKIEAAAKEKAEREAKEAADKAERERIAAEIAKLKAEAAEKANQAEAERKRVEKSRQEELAKAKAEAARLAAEHAAERDRLAAVARAEREEIERKAKAEADAAAAVAAKLRAEIATKEQAEEAERKRVEKERADEALSARKAAAAPDKAKLVAFAKTIGGIDLPEFADEAITFAVRVKVSEMATWVHAQSERLP